MNLKLIILSQILISIFALSKIYGNEECSADPVSAFYPFREVEYLFPYSKRSCLPNFDRFTFEIFYLQDHGYWGYSNTKEVMKTVLQSMISSKELPRGCRFGAGQFNDWAVRTSDYWSYPYLLLSGLTHDWNYMRPLVDKFYTSHEGDYAQSSLFAACMAAFDSKVGWNTDGCSPDGKEIHKLIVINTLARSLVSGDHSNGYYFADKPDEVNIYFYASPTLEKAAEILRARKVGLIVLSSKRKDAYPYGGGDDTYDYWVKDMAKMNLTGSSVQRVTDYGNPTEVLNAFYAGISQYICEADVPKRNDQKVNRCLKQQQPEQQQPEQQQPE